MALTPLETFQAIETEKKKKKNITRLIVGSQDLPDIKIKSKKGKK